MIHRRRKIIRWKRWITAVALAGIVGAGIYYQNIIARSAADIRRVLQRVDAGAIVRGLRREAFGVYCAQDCYVFDAEGMLFGQARSVVGDVIVRVEEVSNKPPLLYKPIMEPAEWGVAALVFQAARAKELDAQRFVLLRAEQELVAYVGGLNLPVYFSLEFSPAEHLRALPLFFKKVNRDALEYVDLRAEGKIFYKNE